MPARGGSCLPGRDWPQIWQCVSDCLQRQTWTKAMTRTKVTDGRNLAWIRQGCLVRHKAYLLFTPKILPVPRRDLEILSPLVSAFHSCLYLYCYSGNYQLSWVCWGNKNSSFCHKNLTKDTFFSSSILSLFTLFSFIFLEMFCRRCRQV